MKKHLSIPAVMLLATASFAHEAPPVPEPLPLNELLPAFGWDLGNAKITTEKITDNLHVLFGLGGNIAVSTGKDGVLIVDDQFPQLVPKIKSAIEKLDAGQDVDFVINTHWHFDHAEGNLVLGPAGTWIVAHENSREMMKQDHVINLVVAAYDQKAYPEDAWPNITYDDDMSFHLNGETVDLYHFGPAHTTGDTVVVFRGSKAVHMGDVFNNAGYPFIDVGNGGSLDGVIQFCSETLKIIDKDTVVIPGHGPIADYEKLQDYIQMLTTIRTRMVKLIDEGASLEEVYEAGVTKEWDKALGDNVGFINRSYTSLTHTSIDK
jgi:glyoxylase-like metal-dependent hydrolase (beta-lactamase superfamily II)